MENEANSTLAAGPAKPGALHELSGILGDIHNQIGSLEERLNLVSTRQNGGEKAALAGGQAPVNSVHVNALVDSANGIRARLGRLFEELNI